jgi:hypothetical protein
MGDEPGIEVKGAKRRGAKTTEKAAEMTGDSAGCVWKCIGCGKMAEKGVELGSGGEKMKILTEEFEVGDGRMECRWRCGVCVKKKLLEGSHDESGKEWLEGVKSGVTEVLKGELDKMSKVQEARFKEMEGKLESAGIGGRVSNEVQHGKTLDRFVEMENKLGELAKGLQDLTEGWKTVSKKRHGGGGGSADVNEIEDGSDGGAGGKLDLSGGGMEMRKVVKEILDCSKINEDRLNNVVICNLEEPKVRYRADRLEEDRKKVMNLAIMLDIEGVNGESYSVVRMGTWREGRNRPLLVRLKDHTTRERFMRHAYKLGEVDEWRDVYINRDMDKEDREREMKLRIELKRKRYEGRRVRMPQGRAVESESLSGGGDEHDREHLVVAGGTVSSPE